MLTINSNFLICLTTNIIGEIRRRIFYKMSIFLSLYQRKLIQSPLQPLKPFHQLSRPGMLKVKGLAGGADQIQLVVLIPPFKLFRRVTDLHCTGIISSGNGTLLIFCHSISLSLE
jgi:hypothetical protein